MKLRSSVETYWAVWIFNERLGDGEWEPFDEGITSKREAAKDRREAEARYPDERFCLVKTTHVRVAAPTRKR